MAGVKQTARKDEAPRHLPVFDGAHHRDSG